MVNEIENETTETPAAPEASQEAKEAPAKRKPAKGKAKPRKWLTPSGKAPRGPYAEATETPKGFKLPPGSGEPWVDALCNGKRVVYLGGKVDWPKAEMESGKECEAILRKAKSMPYAELKPQVGINRLGKLIRLGVVVPR